MVAIILHKGAAGMSLGISMTKTFPSKTKLIAALLFMFSIFTPVGVMIGWSINNDDPLMEIIFTSLAAGTFLYIACQEIISEEFGNSQHRYWKLLFFLIGITMICLLFLLDIDDDDN